MSTFAYLGEVGNRDLNDLCCYNGFFAVNDPTVVHTLNNYPDDSDLTYKIVFRYDTEIKPYIQLYYGEFLDIPLDKVTVYTQLYRHMSGTGDKVITGTLEVESSDDYAMQIFHRLPDDITWKRHKLNGIWSPWVYEINKNTIFHQIADGVKINRNDVKINSGIVNYTPKYDTAPIMAEINTKAGPEDLVQRLSRKNPEFTGELTIENGKLVMMNDFVLDTHDVPIGVRPGSNRSIQASLDGVNYPILQTIAASENGPYGSTTAPNYHLGYLDGLVFFHARRKDNYDRFPLYWSTWEPKNRVLLREHLYWTYIGEGRQIILPTARKNFTEILVYVYHNTNPHWTSTFRVPVLEGRVLQLCVNEWPRVADPEFIYSYHLPTDSITVTSPVFNMKLYAR